ncbi:MAG: outer membrane protein assembly factor BamB family protein [Marinibacterium sp.]
MDSRQGAWIPTAASGRFLRFGAAVRAVALSGIAGLTLQGCVESDVILPGIREDIPEIASAGSDPDPKDNMSAGIRLAGQVANANWPQGHGSEAFRVSHAALSASPQPVFAVNIGDGDDRRHRITATPVVGGGLIYTLDSRARVSAVSPSGTIIWNVDLTPVRDSKDDATGGGLSYSDGTLYVSIGFGRLAALDAATGATRWIQDLDATGSGQPLVSGGLVYLVAGDSTGWAVETDNGRIRWQIDGPTSVSNVLGAPSPALVDDLVVFAFGSGDLVAAFRQGGLRRWGASVAGRRPGSSAARIGDVTGDPVVVGRTVYVGNASGRIVALDGQSGDRLWTAPFGAETPVWPAGGSLFALTDANQLVRMNASDGTPIWAVDLPRYVKDTPGRRGPVFAHYGPILAGGRIWVASSDGFLRGFNPQDGSLAAMLDVPGGATTAPVVAGKTLYVVSKKGQLYAFR